MAQWVWGGAGVLPKEVTMVNRVCAAAAGVAAVRWGLERRQADVLALVVRGCGDQLIARTLGCPLEMIEIDVVVLIRKAGVRTRSQLVETVVGQQQMAAAR
jgi:DNA-binding CsgD family transcriptional regulator